MSFISAFEDNVYTGAIMTVDTSQVYDICYLASHTRIYLVESECKSRHARSVCDSASYG
jgi:hypothetical protein